MRASNEMLTKISLLLGRSTCLLREERTAYSAFTLLPRSIHTRDNDDDKGNGAAVGNKLDNNNADNADNPRTTISPAQDATEHTTPPRPSKNAAMKEFKRSIARKDVQLAEEALQRYFTATGPLPPPRHMIHALMDVHIRTQSNPAHRVLVLLDTLVRQRQTTLGPGPNVYSYGYSLAALKKGIGVGGRGGVPTSPTDTQITNIPQKALGLFQQMKSLSIQPNQTIYNELSDIYATVGDVDTCFELFDQSIRVDLLNPSIASFTILIKACGVAGDLDRGLDVITNIMPSFGFRPTEATAAWNSLLMASTVHSNISSNNTSGVSIDRSYEIWEGMKKEGVVPDGFTERALAKAFESHPQLAAEMVTEARQMREREGGGGEGMKKQQSHHIKQSTPLSIDNNSSRSRSSTTTSTIIHNTTQASVLGLAPTFFLPSENNKETSDDLSLSITPDETSSQEQQEQQIMDIDALLYLDLHGHSQAAARMALLRRLEALVKVRTLLETHTIDTKKFPGLIIVTGVGKGSVGGVGVLADTVLSALREQGLEASPVVGNVGRLMVRMDDVTEFTTKQYHAMQREHVFAVARARYGVVGAGLATVLAVSFIIPRLGPWL